LSYSTTAAEIKGLIEANSIALAESLSTESYTTNTVIQIGLIDADGSCNEIIAALEASTIKFST